MLSKGSRRCDVRRVLEWGIIEPIRHLARNNRLVQALLRGGQTIEFEQRMPEGFRGQWAGSMRQHIEAILESATERSNALPHGMFDLNSEREST
jgi:hypothetical protein